jgi:hypothetical protein
VDEYGMLTRIVARRLREMFPNWRLDEVIMVSGDLHRLQIRMSVAWVDVDARSTTPEELVDYLAPIDLEEVERLVGPYRLRKRFRRPRYAIDRHRLGDV